MATTHTIESEILDALEIRVLSPGKYSLDPCGDREEIVFRPCVTLTTPTAVLFSWDDEPSFDGPLSFRLHGLREVLESLGSCNAETARMTATLVRGAISGASAVSVWDIEFSY